MYFQDVVDQPHIIYLGITRDLEERFAHHKYDIKGVKDLKILPMATFSNKGSANAAKKILLNAIRD